MKLALTALRAVLGATMFAHGAQKLFGWFGGHGLEGTGQFFDGIGLQPGKRSALVAGASEVGGGALLATGFLTPLGSAATIGVMTQAIESVHKPKGFFNTEGGYEFPLLVVASALALAETGPGPLSLDRALGTERSGTLWALAALGAGIAGPRLLRPLATSGASEPPGAPAPAPQSDGHQQAAPETVGASH
jgi:putative oxidoreductase